MSNCKLVVEICHAHNLMPKDGQGSSSPFVEVDFNGQRQKTKTVMRDLNPYWNQKLIFNATQSSFDQCIEVNIYNEKKTNPRNFLGRVRVHGCTIAKMGDEAFVTSYPLEKRGLFSHIKGELFMKIYYYNEPTKTPKVALKKTEEVVEEKPKEAPKKTEEAVEEKPKAAPKKIEEVIEEKPKKKPMMVEMESKVDLSHQAYPSDPVEFRLKETNPQLGNTNHRWGKASTTYDLVERKEYLFVRVVKARNLGLVDPYVNVKVGNETAITRVAEKTLNPEWNEVFVFGKDEFQPPSVDVIVKGKDGYLGHVCFDISEVPSRMASGSPLAPEWHHMEKKVSSSGEVMLSIWKGTQADEAFSGSSGGHSSMHSKIYLSPKLWYLRVNVIEAQELNPVEKGRFPEFSVRAQLGFQVMKTRVVSVRSNSPFWNEDLMFVAAEPFEESLVVQVEDRGLLPNKEEVLGKVQIPLSTIESRIDHRPTISKWYDLERVAEKKAGQSRFSSRVHLRVCLDGGYHVLDESIHHSSDWRPTAKQLWKSPVGILQLGILGCTNLSPMKKKYGRGTADAYCVAKYGEKWARTRVITDSFHPRWNEQYTWHVYDPCTVLTVAVFDNCEFPERVGAKDAEIGKVRIRLSTLDSDRVYTHSYPLLLLRPSGWQKAGDLELAVRFSCTSLMNTMQIYSEPLLPRMHYLKPLGIAQLEILRSATTKIVASRLSRAEPPLRQEVIQYMLDADSSQAWSMHKSKVNWFRIMSVLAGAVSVMKWLDGVRVWKNSVTTVLVHILFLTLVSCPHLILPTIFFYTCLVGLWRYRRRPVQHPSPNDIGVLHVADSEDVEEEFDPIPTAESHEVVRARYDRLRSVGGRVQTVLGDMATAGERFEALLSWRDPRATGMFTIVSLVGSLALYVIPFRLIVVLLGLYALRHPRFRQNLPALPVNFLRRLPSLSDRML